VPVYALFTNEQLAQMFQRRCQWWQLEQRRSELPDGEPQHERSDEPHEQQRLPLGAEFRWFGRLCPESWTEQIVSQTDQEQSSPAKSKPKTAWCW